jgi:hypothetical protein
MNLWQKIGMILLGSFLCTFGIVSFFKPKKVIDFYLRTTLLKKGFWYNHHKEMANSKLYVINTKICGVCSFLMGVLYACGGIFSHYKP